MKTYIAGIAALLLAAAAPAFAQQDSRARQDFRIHGQIEKADGGTLLVKARDGASYTVKVADDARVTGLDKASLADIKPDTFIGVAGMPATDGRIAAFSIHIFMASQRGVVPDRHGPWQGREGATMTNAYAGTVTKSAAGDVISVKYKGGEKDIIVTPETSIVAIAPGTRDELKAGAQIIVTQSEKAADGTLVGKAFFVGHGLTPAM